MKYAVSTNRVKEVPQGYAIGYGAQGKSLFGIDSPMETTIAEVQIVEADSKVEALNQVLTHCPDFSEENDIDGLVAWLGLINIVVSVPITVE